MHVAFYCFLVFSFYYALYMLSIHKTIYFRLAQVRTLAKLAFILAEMCF